MSIPALGLGRPPQPNAAPPVSGRDYLLKLHKYLSANIARLAPPQARGKPQDASWLAQSYTLLTLGLDPSSAPLSRQLKVPLTLGFGKPAPPQPARPAKPVLLRLPPDKLLYLLLRWQSLPQALPHVGRTDVAVPDGVVSAAKGATGGRHLEGDVESVRSWVGSIRTVSGVNRVGSGWFSRPQVVDEDKILLELYTVFNALPGLLIHPPFASDARVAELLDAGGYTILGGVDVRVPLDVMRNLQMLELDAFDPRGLLIPPNALLHSLSVHDVEDADDWIVELLVDTPAKEGGDTLAVPEESPALSDNSYGSLLEGDPDLPPRFPNLRHLSIHHAGLLALPTLPLTSLTHLDLSHNLLNAIPDSLSALHNLRSLNLSNNLITSVRNASSALGNVGTINLSHNRIDCLIGLDRVPGLRRVDVRSNALLEAGEVGRLAVLPLIEAVWTTSNPFAQPEADWRVDVAAYFAVEGRDLTIDDTPLSWAEARRVDAQLAARGKRRPHAPSAPASAAPTAPSSPTLPTPAAGIAGGLAPPSPARAVRSAPVAPPSPSHRKPSAPGEPAAIRSSADSSPSPLSPVGSPRKAPARAKSPTEPAAGEITSGRDSTTATPVKANRRRRAKRRVVNLDNEGAANGSGSGAGSRNGAS